MPIRFPELAKLITGAVRGSEKKAAKTLAMDEASLARETLRKKLSGKLNPDVLDQVLKSADIPTPEAMAINEAGVSPWTIRTTVPENIKIEDLIALGKENIKPSTKQQFNIPVDELWKHREYDRLGADSYKTSEEIQALRESIQKEGIKTPLQLKISTPDRPITKGRWNEPVDALLREGNHRLALAKELGLKTVPVTIGGLVGAVLAGKNSTLVPESEEERWSKIQSSIKE